jgi:hypothetical protein
MGRYLLAWFPMILIAVANGALREAWLVPRLGDHAARQVSTLLLIAFFAVYIGYVTRRWPIASSGEALAVGRLWALVPVWVAAAPCVCFRLWRAGRRPRDWL